MPSPVLQAKRQGRFLQLYLQDHVEELLDRMLGVLQKQVGSMTIDVLVAVSDSGIIRRPKGLPLDEVCKADQAPDKARSIVERRRRETSLFNLNLKEGGYAFTDKELFRVSAFLRQHHRPLEAAPQPPAPPQPEGEPRPTVSQEQRAAQQGRAATITPTCRNCRSTSVEIVYGKYGYFFKCRDCGGNTPINATCPVCGGKQRTRKDGPRFFAECPTCGTSDLYFTNPLT
jgi:hypothetical protein